MYTDPNICTRCGQHIDKHIGTVRTCPNDPLLGTYNFGAHLKVINCDHQFVAIEQITKPTPQAGTVVGLRFSEIHGVRVGCAKCAEIRALWEDGVLTIEKPRYPMHTVDSNKHLAHDGQHDTTFNPTAKTTNDSTHQ